ncbi:MFS transporter [Desmospora profundinema]|uniref:MFS family permease n=1 Tax=Desmospora profundinema TaxID=1571184 RepID=A0ABU1IP75_9BACL|nr:MFS transporter [Desmospora profundinema]MDR6226587.1 MFS family permease [Desmospora profundinema]
MSEEKAEDQPIEKITSVLKVWLPSFLVFFSYSLTVFSLNWFITQSPAGGGGVLGVIVGVSNLIATVVVVMLSGLIDRINRNRFLLFVQILMFVEVICLLIPYTGLVKDFIMILVVAFIFIGLQSTFSLYSAALETTIADLAPRGWPSNRTALMIQLQPQVGRFVAPILGGGVLAMGLIWLTSIVAGVAILLTTGLLLLWAQIVSSSQPVPESKSKLTFRTMWADARIAARWIVTRPVLIFMLVIGFVTNLVIPPFYSLLPAFITEMHLENEATFYGQFSGAFGAGMLITSMIFMSLAKATKRPGVVAAGLVLMISIVLGLITVIHNTVFLITSSFVLGVLFILLVMFGGGAWLDLTPSKIRVRVFSLKRLIAFVSIPLGSVLMGLGGAAIGYMTFLLILLVVVVVGVGVAVLLCRGWNHEVSRVEENLQADTAS